MNKTLTPSALENPRAAGEREAPLVSPGPLGAPAIEARSRKARAPHGATPAPSPAVEVETYRAVFACASCRPDTPTHGHEADRGRG